MRIAILAMLGLATAGCTTLSTPSGTAPAPQVSSGLDRAYRACQSAYDNGTIPNRTGRAKCFNDAETRFATDFPDRQRLQRQQALRLSLAMKLDSGALTQAQANAAYAKGMAQL